MTGPGLTVAALGTPGHGDRPRTGQEKLVARASGLAMFDAFASWEADLHSDQGGHLDVPAFELDASERFFVRHLADDDTSAATSVTPVPSVTSVTSAPRAGAMTAS
ncbi:hypothetical protein [Nonomuraea sp. NPDC050691]|uniref:hypothetical protein n=1 Tax=Nonomuraea sp. NPDC050691 TaxID=3155661 RepID=UPI0033D49DFC